MNFPGVIFHLFVSALTVSVVVAAPTSLPLESREGITTYERICFPAVSAEIEKKETET